MRQFFTPSYSTTLGRFSHVPLQRTTATLGALTAASIPRMAATLFIHSWPPTGHESPSSEPWSAALTQAAAIPPHPGNPQPPQLAPGNASCTRPMRGSSFTANFLAVPQSTNAAIRPIAPRTHTAIKITFVIIIISFYTIFLSIQNSNCLLRTPFIRCSVR